MVKKIVPLVALLAVLGGVYKFVLAKPAKAVPKAHVEGIIYPLKKEFLVNLKDGRYAKLTVGLVLEHTDTAHLPAAEGHGAASPPEGYGDMAQEGIVRSLITSVITDKPADELTDEHHREELAKEMVKLIKKKTDVKIEEVFFPDITVQ